MDLPFLQRHILAVVPDVQSIEVAQLRGRGRGSRVVARYDIDTSDPAHPSPEKCFRHELAQRGLQNLPCVFCLRSSHFSVKTIRIPFSSSPARIRHLAHTHLEEFERLSETKALTEYTLSTLGPHRYLILFTMREDTLFEELRLIQGAGLKLKEVIPHPLALFEGIQLAFPHSSGIRLCVHITPENITLVLGKNHSLLHLRTLTLSNLPSTDLENTQDTLPPWLTELKTAISHYLEDLLPPDESLHDVVLSGHPLPDEPQSILLQHALSLPVHLYPGSAPCSPAALGLSQVLRSSPAISLLPTPQRLAARQRRFSICWVLSCLLLLLTLFAYTIHIRKRNAWLDKIRTRTEVLAAHYQSLQQQRDTLASRDADLRQKVIPLRNTLRNQQMVNRLTRALHFASSEQDWFVLLSDADSYFSGVDRARLSPEPAETLLRFIVEGYTPVNDLSTVRSMIENLRKDALILSVDLLPDDQIHSLTAPSFDENDSLRRFALELVLQRPGT